VKFFFPSVRTIRLAVCRFSNGMEFPQRIVGGIRYFVFGERAGGIPTDFRVHHDAENPDVLVNLSGY
jgi:hypothetical protein